MFSQDFTTISDLWSASERDIIKGWVSIGIQILSYIYLCFIVYMDVRAYVSACLCVDKKIISVKWFIQQGQPALICCSHSFFLAHEPNI